MRNQVSSSKYLVLSRHGFILYTLYLLLNTCLFAQSPPIKKSDKVETIDGKKYFIHSAEKGQTLYSISKTYGTTVDIILAHNQEAIEGLKQGDKLKIPFSGNTDMIKKEIDKQSREQAKAGKITKAKSPPSDSTATVSLPIQKNDSLLTPNENIKPIGDIHVALFLPLDLAKVENIDVGKVAQGDEKIPEDTKTGIEFYEGVKLAFDSLRKQGFKGFLHVYDSDLDSASFARLMKKPELKDMDMIIGPLFGKKFEVVLKFSKENNINIVSPTLPGNNMLLGNPHASKMTPSYVTQTEVLATYVTEKYAGQNIILFNSTKSKDKPYLNTFKRIANPILVKVNADTVKEVTFATLKNFISKTKPNIVIVPSTDQSFITEAVNKLYLLKQENRDSIIVLGLSNFQEIQSLDFGYLNTLNTIISSHTFVDYGNTETKKIILNYRKEFKTDPTQHVYSGFDAAYFYLDGLQKYGNSFQRKLPEIKHKGIQTEFNFFQTGINSGYENKGVGILKFENYSYIRVK